MVKKIVIGLLGLMLCSVAFAACRVVDADTLPKNPKVQLATSVFVQTQVSISKGQRLDLVNTASDAHTILNGTWVGTTQKQVAENGAPAVNVNVAGDQTVTIGPFTTAGTFLIYCSVHQGMNLTVVVS